LLLAYIRISLVTLTLVIYIYYSEFFSRLHDIGTMFSPLLAMTNLYLGICGAHKVGCSSPPPTEFINLCREIYGAHKVGSPLPTKFTNMCLGTCGTHKVNSPLPTEFSWYAWVRNRTLTARLRRPSPLPFEAIHYWLL
jgi:hypothetical protein